MRRVWIIGAGGLLGRALGRTLKTVGVDVFTPSEPLVWSNQERLLTQLEVAVQAFSRVVGCDDNWEIYWAAGIGTFASIAEDLERETVALDAFLRMLEVQPSLQSAPGSIGFASSAGAIYAGNRDEVINEDTPVAPTTPYAYAKLAQEALVRTFIERQTCANAVVARISTLYGVGQAERKSQGLLTHIARSIVRNKPIQIYVPFDTIRDYISANDAAARLVLLVREQRVQACCQMRVLASETPTTIAEIIAIFKRVSRHTPRVVTSVSRNTAFYTRRVQFRSNAPAGLRTLPSTSLLVGIGQLLQAERFNYAQSSGSKAAR